MSLVRWLQGLRRPCPYSRACVISICWTRTKDGAGCWVLEPEPALRQQAVRGPSPRACCWALSCSGHWGGLWTLSKIQLKCAGLRSSSQAQSW